MEIERINKDTLKVVVDKEDLNRHGLTFLDLLGDHDQIEKFFMDILEEADSLNEFRGDEEALTFQVLPSNNGLEIFIKKSDLDDLPMDGSQNNDIIDPSKPIGNIEKVTKELEQYSTNSSNNAMERVIEYKSFEDLIAVANLLDFHNGASNLYLYNHRYYLDLIFFLNVDGSTESYSDNNLAIAYEFGEPTTISVSELNKNAKKVMDTSAIELIRYYFK